MSLEELLLSVTFHKDKIAYAVFDTWWFSSLHPTLCLDVSMWWIKYQVFDRLGLFCPLEATQWKRQKLSFSVKDGKMVGQSLAGRFEWSKGTTSLDPRSHSGLDHNGTSRAQSSCYSYIQWLVITAEAQVLF